MHFGQRIWSTLAGSDLETSSLRVSFMVSEGAMQVSIEEKQPPVLPSMAMITLMVQQWHAYPGSNQ